MTGPASGRMAKAIGGAISVAIVAAAVYLGWRHYQERAANPLTQDAVIGAETLRVAAAVPGRIVSIGVRENGAVRAGDVLFEIDPEPYRLMVEQTRADLAIAEAAVEDVARNIRAERTNVVIAQEQVERARANLALATQTLDRLLPLEPQRIVSPQQVDDARTAKADAEVSLSQALRQVEAAEEMVGDEAAALALVEARRAAVAVAERELADTVFRAPFDGLVVGLETTAGAFVAPGAALFTLIDTSSWFVSAGYLETTVAGIEIGACATVYVLADRRTPIAGRVESIGWGVGSEVQINLPGVLPIMPKSLDWVRIEQRFPVRIRLDDPPARLMRIGASALAIVHRGDRC